MRRSAFFFVTTALVIIGCTATNNAGSDGGGGGGGGGGSCTPNNTDGASSCQGAPQDVCAGSEYCSINQCRTGCAATANCPNGLFCDLSAPSQDVFIKKPIGLCRACPAAGTTDAGGGGTATCDDVHGAYTIKSDPSSSMGCGTSSGECTVTQTGCAVTLACPMGGGTNTVTINAMDKGTFMGTMTIQGMVVNENCAVSFDNTLGTLLIDCQLTATGGAADCKINGTKK